jgi:preprotein translocase subunit SecE
MAEDVAIQKSLWTRIREYVSDVQVEMRRVTWPGKQEVYGTTVMVIITTFLFGAYFWGCDLVFKRVVGDVLKFFLHKS